MDIEEKVARKCGYGDYPVAVLNHVLIPMRDRIKLSAKLWIPSLDANRFASADHKYDAFYTPSGTQSLVEEKFPAVLEYIPYRKSEYTAPRDHLRHPWMASQGYVIIRVDMRGSGDSEGLYYGEYLEQEQQDAEDVLSWIGKRDWSNQAVGMYGKSWAGFNGLQMAYRQPPELKAIMTMYSTHDRYALDTPHDGGCVIGDALISWSSCMFGWNCRAPDPRLWPGKWKEMWMERLQKASASWCPEWLRHECRDEFWKHGSVCEDYSKVSCPTLAIGGWMDCYTDAVFRLVQNLPNVRGIIGPWPHEWPDKCQPGPNIEYMQLVLKWWDYHLKGIKNDIMDLPKLAIYLQDNIAANEFCKTRPGKWLSADSWPSDKDFEQKSLHLDDFSNLTTEQCKDAKVASPSSPSWKRIPFSVHCGKAHGEWLNFGSPTGSSDQRISDAFSLTFTTEELKQDLPLLGFVRVECKMRVLNHDRGMIAARLVDVAQDESGTLITYGYLNLTHLKGHDEEKVALLEPEKEYVIELELHSASYVIPVGHKLRLSLSACYWPGAWPSSKEVHMEIDTSVSCLKLPLAKSNIKEYHNPLFETKEPQISTPLPITMLSKSDTQMYNEHDIIKKKLTRTVIHDSGRAYLEPLGVITRHSYKEVYEIYENDPLSAKSSTYHTNEFEYPDEIENGGPLKIKAVTECVLNSTADEFKFASSVNCKLNDQDFFDKSWSEEIPRKYL